MNFFQGCLSDRLGVGSSSGLLDLLFLEVAGSIREI
jgi:hypothetical protein